MIYAFNYWFLFSISYEIVRLEYLSITGNFHARSNVLCLVGHRRLATGENRQ